MVLFACVPVDRIELPKAFAVAENVVNGSLTSCEGEDKGEGSADGIALE
jgi:hypothetical protein